MPARKFVSPLPDESDYVARRVGHPWLLRQLWAETLPPGSVVEFLCALARRFNCAPPTVVRSESRISSASPWAEAGGLVELGNYFPEADIGKPVPVGLIVHEYAHVQQYFWWIRMRGPAGKRPEWDDHGPAFIDALDRVAIEAARLLQ